MVDTGDAGDDEPVGNGEGRRRAILWPAAAAWSKARFLWSAPRRVAVKLEIACWRVRCSA